MAHVCVLNHLHDRPRPQDNMMQPELAVERIKQYPGHVQAARKVKVQVPGKHFPGLTAAEQKAFYEGTAIEFTERHSFATHSKAWGAAHKGPGLRFICVSDAIDDPDHKGFWTTVALWNRWRHETFKGNLDAEEQYLDELPAVVAPAVPKGPVEKSPPEIKLWFDVTQTGTHTVEGNGRNAGRVIHATWYACKTPGCPRGHAKPIKQTGTDTGGLFVHLDTCNPQLSRRLHVGSNHSKLKMSEAGEVYEEFSFDEALPHYARFVIKCFQGFDHFYETRANNGLLEFVKGFDQRATLKRIPPEERSGGQVAPSILVSPPGGGSDRSPLTDIPVSGQNRVRIIYRNGPTKSAQRPQPKAQTTSATSGSASWHTTKTSAHAHPEQLIVERTASGLRTAVARRARRHGRGTCATECIGATRGLGSWRKTICT